MRSIFQKRLLYVIICILMFCGAFRIVFPAERISPDLDIKVKMGSRSQIAEDSLLILLTVSIPDGYHLFGNPLGPGIGKPLTLRNSENGYLRLFTASIDKPAKFYPQIGDWVWAYEKSTRIYLQGVVPTQQKPAIDTLFLDGLICKNECISVKKAIPIVLSGLGIENATGGVYSDSSIRRGVADAKPLPVFSRQEKAIVDETATSGLLSSIDATPSFTKPVDQSFSYEPVEETTPMNNILAALFFAFIAGILLNVMPCVLPVLGVKVLSLSSQKDGKRSTTIGNSIAFCAGIVFMFLVLAALVSFAGLFWGEQFHTPEILTIIICVIFVFGLGLFDVYTFNLSSVSGAYPAKSGGNFLKHFMNGIFTTILATPCSGPFLGGTLAWTLTQQPLIVFIVFVMIGVGMAFPYLLLTSSTRLMKIVPRPGPWMEDFRRAMGFLLFGFAIYLMLGLPVYRILFTVGLCLFLAAALMAFTRIAPFGSIWKRKLLASVVAVTIVLAGGYLSFHLLGYATTNQGLQKNNGENSGVWEEFSLQKLYDANRSGRSVVVDFTANWCMNCQFNKLYVYQSPEVLRYIDRKKIVAMKADLTTENPAAESLLHQLGSRSIPFLAIFPGNDPGHPIVMRDILSRERVVAVLRKLPED